MSKRILLGMLTPSSNTILEPVTSAIVANLPEVSVHFSRFRVTEISLTDHALGQFDNSLLLEAAQLLADAKVDVIAWNGTSAGWLGFKRDIDLCQQITQATHISATTSVLALKEVFDDRKIKNFALVTPYIDEIQAQIIANFAEVGIECVAERHLNQSNNFSFSEVDADQIAAMVREVAVVNPQAIVTFCTNLCAAPLVNDLEKQVGIPIFDTVSLAVWKALKIAGVSPARIKNWGSLFTNDL